MRKIGIDARFFGIKQKGLGRYTQKLIENLEQIIDQGAIDWEFYIFLKKENYYEYQPQNPKFKKILADYRWYTFSEQIFFPILLYRMKLDLMHFPHFNVPVFYWKKILVTIHDLTLIHFPTVKNSTLHPFFYKIKFLAYRVVIFLAIWRARNVFAISYFTKNDILKNYPKINPGKIIVTHEAWDDNFYYCKKEDGHILKKYDIIKPYLIYVGNAYPHKNLERLLLSFLDVSRKKSALHLVFVGKDDYFYHRLKMLAKKEKIGKIHFVSDVSDAELDCLFRGAIAHVFPSLYEGFGLPPLEAMSKGIPVIASDHPCMREVLEKSAYYFDGTNVSSISLAINRIIDDSYLRKKLIASGYQQIKKYSWKRMAEKTLKFYQDIK